MSNKELFIVSPLYVEIPRKTKDNKKVYLNLNTYRNLHYAVNNQAKKLYKEVIYRQLLESENGGIRFTRPVEVTMKIYKGSKRKLDKSNVDAIVRKFLYDALVELGVIEDDNDDFIKTETILPTDIDRADPRVEVHFKEI